MRTRPHSAGERPLELGLGHLRAAWNVAPARLLLERLAGFGVLALGLLHGGFAPTLLGLGALQAAFLLALALVPGCARLRQGDGDGLPGAVDLAGLAAGAALQLAVLVLVHHTVDGVPLGFGLLGHICVASFRPRGTRDAALEFR